VSTVNTIIIVVALISIIAIFGVRSRPNADVDVDEVERRPLPDDRKDID
jgi:hypothetical protein